MKWQSIESFFWMSWFSHLYLHTYSFVLIRFPPLSQNTQGNQPWKRKDLPWFGVRGLDPQLVGSAAVRTVESQIVMAVVHRGAQLLTSKRPRRKDWVKDVQMRKWMGARVERLIYGLLNEWLHKSCVHSWMGSRMNQFTHLSMPSVLISFLYTTPPIESKPLAQGTWGHLSSKP